MTEAETRLLAALARMSAQYLHTDGNFLDHRFMSAGERAVELLVEYGLVKPGPRGGEWTETGIAFLKA